MILHSVLGSEGLLDFPVLGEVRRFTCHLLGETAERRTKLKEIHMGLIRRNIKKIAIILAVPLCAFTIGRHSWDI